MIPTMRTVDVRCRGTRYLVHLAALHPSDAGLGGESKLVVVCSSIARARVVQRYRDDLASASARELVKEFGLLDGDGPGLLAAVRALLGIDPPQLDVEVSVSVLNPGGAP